MNIISFRKRFQEVRGIYVGNRLSLVTRVFLYFDWLLAFIVHGASIKDYFAYSFYKLRYNGKKEYITYRRHRAIQKKCNKVSDRCLCREKNKFNSLFKDFLGRDWIDVNDVNEAQFVLFCQKYSIVFIKEINGYEGKGTRKIETNKLNAKDLYKELVSDKKSHYIAEEQLTQIRVLANFHPWSINTIRMVTVYDPINDDVHIMSACFRMGNRKFSVDNFHFEGIGANINIETGVIESVGYDGFNKTYIQHPLTGEQIVGFQIPYWNECKLFAIQAAKNISTVRYVGWDIVIQEGGRCVLVEGNDNADHDIQQIHNKGLWKQYQSIIKRF